KALQDYDDEGSVGAFLARHRTAVGGITAFAVTFAYVAANAIWYQPHAHGSAFFSTRPLAAPVEGGGLAGGAAGSETISRIEREGAREQEPRPAPVTRPAVGAVPEPRTVAGAPAAPDPSGDPVVEEVQRILAELNFYNGQVDGLTGP